MSEKFHKTAGPEAEIDHIITVLVAAGLILGGFRMIWAMLRWSFGPILPASSRTPEPKATDWTKYDYKNMGPRTGGETNDN